MNLSFNIIYTPGSVQYLCPFVFSLLNWSNCNFRLISNGCSLEESLLLKKLCYESDRLEYILLPLSETIKHGHALNYLQRFCEKEFFCFMDSDIFASGLFIKEFISLFKNHSALFSCRPLWCKPSEQILPEDDVRMRGWYNQCGPYFCLGSSYFAIYNQNVLNYYIKNTGITFQRYSWSDVPDNLKKAISEKGLRKKVYDTGKLLNVILGLRGENLINIESRHLKHIGGLSNRIFTSTSKRRDINAISKVLLNELSELRAKQLLELMRRREIFLEYFSRLIESFYLEDIKPDLPSGLDKSMYISIAQLTIDIKNIFEEKNMISSS